MIITTVPHKLWESPCEMNSHLACNIRYKICSKVVNIQATLMLQQNKHVLHLASVIMSPHKHAISKLFCLPC